MIEKKEGNHAIPDAESLAQTCQHLETATLQAQAEVKLTFSKLLDALHAREKQLLRQIDVAHTQQLARLQSISENPLSENVPHVTVQFDTEPLAINAIASLGAVGLTGGSLVAVNGDGPFLQRMEDYQDANQDHISMFKPVPMDSSSPVHETVIRFSHIALPPSTCKPKLESLEKIHDKMDNHQEKHLKFARAEASKSADNPPKRKHPGQVRQWLRQLSAEIEIEPSFGGEPKHFEIQ